MRDTIAEVFAFLFAMALMLVVCSMAAARADEIARAPGGIADFCSYIPSLCLKAAPKAASLKQTDTIIRVNRFVNEGILPLEDASNPALNSKDHWDVIAPDGVGDCEDYALTKMFLLRWAGVPAGAMRLALVNVDHGLMQTKHVVLVVRIGSAEFVLDNRDASVQPADYPAYRWLMISREGSLREWDAISEAPQ